MATAFGYISRCVQVFKAHGVNDLRTLDAQHKFSQALANAHIAELQCVAIAFIDAVGEILDVFLLVVEAHIIIIDLEQFAPQAVHGLSLLLLFGLGCEFTGALIQPEDGGDFLLFVVALAVRFQSP